MKYILYITLFSFLQKISSEELSEDYNILNLEGYDSEYYEVTDGMEFSAFKFHKSKPITSSIKRIDLQDTTLTVPFIILVIFRLDEPSCLFTIFDKEVLKLGLCFTLAGVNITRITLEGEGMPDKQVEFSYGERLPDWTKMLLHVEESSVKLYFNCSLTDESVHEEKVKDIYFSNDAVLNLGHYEKGNRYFNGSVQEIKIIPNADESVLELYNHCSDVPILPLSTDSGETDDTDSGETDDDPPPESLTRFTEVKAEKGEKGDKGDPGDALIGPQGPPGPQGPIGPRGQKGEEGSCACSESVVSSLLRKMPEMRGVPGERGPKGETGHPGAAGRDGFKGDMGDTGPKGAKGEIGERGDDGAPGKDGSPGSKGPRGETGDPGPQGPEGPRGPPGPPGPACKGTDETKEVPLPGDKGDRGPVGPPGPRGDQGDKGEKGHQGDKGHKGDQGERGESGLDGRTGDPGSDGRPAEKGDKGDMGDKGAPGLPGLPATLYSLLDPDMDPKENAAIVEKLRGHKGETGKTGDKGLKGDIGPIGPPGSPGKDGRDGHCDKGHRGEMGPRGHKGEPGEPGLPATVLPTNITVTKGPKGDRGLKGNVGKTGPRGPTGPKGPKGNTGAMGPKGPHGEKGPIGQKGEKGESVTNSIDMEKLKGEKGDRGDDGRPGNDGKPGPPGKCLETCKSHVIQGPPGPPGPPGISITGPKGEPGVTLSEKEIYGFIDSDRHGNTLDDEDEVYTTTTIVFKSVTALKKHTPSTRLGTLAYVIRERTLVLRVENGWQHVMMDYLIDARDQTTTTYRPPLNRIDDVPTKRSPSDMPSIRLIALNEPYSGNMLTYNNKTGLKSASLACHLQAQQNGIRGNFVAFLANKAEDLRNLVKNQSDRKYPIVNRFGDILFKSWLDMFNGSGATFAKSANIYSFNGKNVVTDPTWPAKAVWHGGDTYGYYSPHAFCEEWTSNSQHLFGLASSLAHNKLLEQNMFHCDRKLIVLCVEDTISLNQGRPIRRRQRHMSSRTRGYRRASTMQIPKL